MLLEHPGSVLCRYSIGPTLLQTKLTSRGWSALHFREGNRKQCKTGLVQDNEIVSYLPSIGQRADVDQGPCGEEWDDDYDGDMTSKPLWGFPNADGISVACADTIVERNVRSLLIQCISEADSRLYSIPLMELLSFSVRGVVRFDIITYSHVRGLSSEVCPSFSSPRLTFLPWTIDHHRSPCSR
jgi:hypothetical protein